MARYGVPQLRSLTFRLSDLDGSSRGARDFVRQRLPEFTQRNPQIKIETVWKRNRHPIVVAHYASGKILNSGDTRPYVVDLKNKHSRTIMEQVQYLRGRIGTGKRDLNHKHQTFHPTIQGYWHLDLGLDKLSLVDAPPKKDAAPTSAPS